MNPAANRTAISAVAAFVLALALSGCTSSPVPDGIAGDSTTAPSAPAEGSVGSGFRGSDNEIRGRATDGTLWAVFYHFRPGEPLKTLWRMTGDGTFSVYALGPSGQRVEPTWGPELHTGSNWNRPGDEWGVGWTIPEPGRWTFHASRGSDASGTVAAMFRS